MRTLTDIFAPGAPPLPEGLRTLVVSPQREVEPGMTVSATFTFVNQGGAPATGVRVRMPLPEGLSYLVGSSTLDGKPLDDEAGNSPLLARGGALVGDIAPGEERTVATRYSVAGAIENGSVIEMQAVLSSFELAPIGSNLVRLLVRSRPVLQNEGSYVAAGGRAEPVPSSEVTLTVRVHNAGQSSAHDVIAVVPVPEHTAYIEGSARYNGRQLSAENGRAPFAHAGPVVARVLGPGATATLEYKVRIDDPLPDATEITARATIASQETPPFDLAPAQLTVSSKPRLDDEQTNFLIEPQYQVDAGAPVAMRLRLHNAGTATAQEVRATVTLPAGLQAVRGASRLDGAALADRKRDQPVFEIGPLEPRASAELELLAVALAPAEPGAALPIVAHIEWSGGERRFERTLIVRSNPAFSVRRSHFERPLRSTVLPAEEIEARVFVLNEGTAPASDVALALFADEGLRDVRIMEKSARMPLRAGRVSLGTIEPYASRRLTVRARVATPVPDATELAMRAVLFSRELGETDLGGATYRVHSRPLLSVRGSRITRTGDEVVRPERTAEMLVHLENEGTDVARDVRVRLLIPPEAQLDSVDGATRDGTALVFGDIAPAQTVEARAKVRLVRPLPDGEALTVEAVASGYGVLPVPLEPISFETAAEPDFSGATLHSEPQDLVDAGAALVYALTVRNTGDGRASELRVSVAGLEQTAYVPGSTSVNGLSVRDRGAVSALFEQEGLLLRALEPGIEATIRWQVLTHNTLPDGTPISARVRLEYGARVDEIAGKPLKVRAAPAFAPAATGLPFGVEGLVAAPRAQLSSQPAHLALPLPAQRELPQHDEIADEPLTAEWSDIPEAAPPEVAPQSPREGIAAAPSAPQKRTVETVLLLDQSRVARVARVLRDRPLDGLLGHLFCLRAFFPDAFVSEPDLAGNMADVTHAYRTVLDRLFIKHRLSRFSIAAADLETQAARRALLGLLDAVPHTRPRERSFEGAALVVRGSVESTQITQLANELRAAPLGGALPWLILVNLCGQHVSGEREGVLARYRTLLIETLAPLANETPQRFLEVARERATRDLDAAREQLLAAFEQPQPVFV